MSWYHVHHVTREEFEKRVEEQRRFDLLETRGREEADERAKTTFSLRANELSTGKRALQAAAAMRVETDTEQSLAKAQRERRVHREQDVQEQALAAELQRLNHDTVTDDKMRQQIRQTSVELRELEAMLKAAYVSKAHVTQIAEKEALKTQEKAMDVAAAHVMLEQCRREEHAEQQKQLAKYLRTRSNHLQVKRQMEEKEMRKKMDIEENIRDKMLVDEIVRKTIEEDEKARELERQNREMLQRFIAEQQARRLEDSRRAHELQKAEDRRVADVAREKALKDELFRAKKASDDNTRQLIQQQMAAKLHAEQSAKLDAEQMRLELSSEERVERERQRELTDLERRRRLRDELQQAQRDDATQYDLKQKQQQQMEHYQLQQMLAKWAEDDRQEMMKAEQRRQRKLEYRQLCNQLDVERHNQLIADKERERAVLDAQRQQCDAEQQMMEQERARLLLQHAPHLLGHLPPGVIRHEQDLQLLGDDFKAAYQQQPCHPFTDSQLIFPD